MNPLKEYLINFGQLNEGRHSFFYQIDDAFFSHFERSIIDKANLNLAVEVEKSNENLNAFKFHFEGEVALNCDRCLDEYYHPIDQNNQLLVKVGSEASHGDEIIFLKEDEYQIDISSFIYEFVTLTIPIKHVCAEVGKQCNPEMEKLILKNQSSKFTEKTDPRWDKLKSIRINK